MGLKEVMQDKDLDTPLALPDSWHFLKKGKLRIIIMFEDGSYKDYYRKLKKNYHIEIKKKAYMIIPDAIIKGKNPTLIYAFNNPMPYKLKFERSKISAKDITSPDKLRKLSKDKLYNLTSTMMDSSSIKVGFNSNLVNRMYQEGFWTTKTMIITLIVVFIIVIVILHFTGVINITELLTGQAKK